MGSTSTVKLPAEMEELILRTVFEVCDECAAENIPMPASVITSGVVQLLSRHPALAKVFAIHPAEVERELRAVIAPVVQDAITAWAATVS